MSLIAASPVQELKTLVISCHLAEFQMDISSHNFHRLFQGLARTQIPTNTNNAVEFPTFGEIAGVNPTGVQWKGLALGEPPS